MEERCEPGADPLDLVIPQCDATASRQPCWQLAPEPECADSPTPLGLDVVYTTPPPEGTRVNGSCVVE